MQALLDTIATLPRPTEACRVFHGRGGLHAGCEQWVLDAYLPVLVLTSFAPAADEALAIIGVALEQRWAQIALPGDGPLCWVFQQRGGAQRLDGRSDTRLMAGAVPQPHVVAEGGARYLVNVLRGQNHGLFLDMAAGRRRVAELVAQQTAAPARAVSPGVNQGHGARVLNLFAYTCAFSVVALRAGAARVVNVDMSRGALATGQQNHRLNGLGNGPGRGRGVLGARHLQLLGQDRPRRALRPGDCRPAQLPEGQLRGHQGLRPPAVPPARSAGAGRPRAAVPERAGAAA